MSNDLQKAASEARKFAKSLESLVAVADQLEKFGSMEQAAKDAEDYAAKQRAEGERIKAKYEVEAEKAEIALCEARDEAKRIVDEAKAKAAASNAKVKQYDGTLKKQIAALEDELAAKVKKVVDLEKANTALEDDMKVLTADLKFAHDRIAKFMAALEG